MKNTNKCRDLLIVSGFWLILFAGCSSLPKETVQNSERNTRALSFLEMGHQQYRSGHYRKAGAYFEKALTSHASVDDGAGVAQALNALGRSQLALGDFGQAELNFQQARLAVEGLNQPELEARALGGLGALELHRRQPEKALVWFETALDLPLDDPGTTRATLLHDLGSAHRKLDHPESAESYFRLALAMHEILRDLKGIAADCYSLAQMHEAENALVPALENARRALSHDKKADNPLGVAQDLTLLGNLSATNGDTEQAADYYRRAKLAWQALGRQDRCDEITRRLQRIE